MKEETTKLIGQTMCFLPFIF